MLPIDKKFYIIGTNNFQINTLQPFNKLICEFFDYISTKILNDRNKFEYSDILALGFWYRKNNILAMKKKFHDGNFKHPIGTVFHITPNMFLLILHIPCFLG